MRQGGGTNSNVQRPPAPDLLLLPLWWEIRSSLGESHKEPEGSSHDRSSTGAEGGGVHLGSQERFPGGTEDAAAIRGMNPVHPGEGGRAHSRPRDPHEKDKCSESRKSLGGSLKGGL